MSLKKQANPEADKAEQKYLAKDNFQMEKRSQLRRLAPLGVEGNEPAARA